MTGVKSAGVFDRGAVPDFGRVSGFRGNEDPGDLRARAIGLTTRTNGLLKTDWWQNGLAEEVAKNASEAFEIFTRLGETPGIGTSGLLLTQVLAVAGERHSALQVLETARQAFERLNDNASLQAVEALRNVIQSMR